jgi:hypothetical protein
MADENGREMLGREKAKDLFAGLLQGTSGTQNTRPFDLSVSAAHPVRRGSILEQEHLSRCEQPK